MSTSQLSSGTVVEGGFTVGDPVRTRTGATTHEATGPRGQTVHLTAHGPECFPSALVLERSLRELRQLQQVEVPQMLAVAGCDKLEGGGIFEVHEPVVAPTLADKLAEGALPVEEAATIIGQVGEALLAGQQAGVIHRNLDADVILVSDGGIKLGGFAVGAPRGEAAFGPLDTIAPEQVEGKVVDQRTLVYNLAALMHHMLTGAPLFEGDPASKLSRHATEAPPDGVHATLARALSKDPRMRPMMLRQFLAELTAMGGVAAPGSDAARHPTSGGGQGRPSTRGWTMFMQAEETGTEPAKPAAPAQPSQAAKPATPAQPSQPSQPAASGGKPSTRGWTMFMNADDAGTAEEAKPAAKPAAPSQQEAKPAAPAQPSQPSQPAASGGKPSTRGWTMFMNADDAGTAEEAKPEAKPAAPAQPSQAAKPAAPAQPSQPSQPAASGGKPSTRGWTMFMDAKDGGEQQSAPSAAKPEAQPPAKPAAPAQPSQPSQPAASGGKPSTRGWTMFMDAGKGEGPGGSAAKPPASTPQPPQPQAQPPQAQPPQAEPPQARGAGPQQPTAPEPASSPPRQSSQMPAQPPAGAGTSGSPEDVGKPSTRGWTMFMEAPLPGKGGKPQGAAPASAQPPSKQTSDAKGWTVFSEDGPPGPPTQQQTPPQQPQQSRPQPPAGKPTGGRTVMASGMPPAADAQPDSQRPPAVTGRTVFASAPPSKPQAETPDTMYFKRGETEPEQSERAASGPTQWGQSSDDVRVPSSGAALEKAAQSDDAAPAESDAAAPAVMPGRDAPVAREGSNTGRTVALVVVALVVLGALIGAVVAFA